MDAQYEAELAAEAVCGIAETFFNQNKACLDTLHECWSFVQACEMKGRSISDEERQRVNDRFHAAIVAIESQESIITDFANQVGVSLVWLSRLLEQSSHNGVCLLPDFGVTITNTSAEIRLVMKRWQSMKRKEFEIGDSHESSPMTTWKKQHGQDSDEISRADLLLMLKWTSQNINYHTDNNGFPRPCRMVGKKQCFRISEVDEWIKVNSSKS